MSNGARFDFRGAQVLVTGGTSGIGLGTATSFRDAGAAVTITGTRAAASEYDTDLAGFTYLPLQLTDPGSAEALVAQLGPLDVLVNNGGAAMPGGRDEWDPEVFAESLALNLTGAMRLSVACRNRLAASEMDGGASVVLLASMSSFRAVPMVPGYSSAKAGIVALTRNLAVQWSGTGIRVNAVAPGLIDTPMTAPMAAFPELLQPELDRVALGRMGTPAEVAPAVLFLCSGAAAYVTGTVLAVDGGYLAH